RADLLALRGGPRGLQPCLAGAGRESVDERFTKDAELPLERILQHAVKRAPCLLEFVLYAHGGIFAFLPDCMRSCFPASAHEEQMRSRFHIVFERGRIFLWKPSATDVTMSTVASAGRVPSSRRRGGRRGRRGGGGCGLCPRRGSRRGRLRRSGRDSAGRDHGNPLDEHPVTRDAYELDSVVDEDRRAELELVLGEQRLAALRRDHVDFPFRLLLPEAIRHLLDAAFLKVLNRRKKGDRDHRFVGVPEPPT